MAYKLLHEGKRSFTAITQQDLLPGYLVKAMSTSLGLTVSGATAYDTVLEVDKCDAAADDAPCVGICVGSITSGNKAPIYQDGIYQMGAGGTITAGQEVSTTTDPLSVATATFVCTGSTNSLLYEKRIGQALNTAASGAEVAVALNV